MNRYCVLILLFSTWPLIAQSSEEAIVGTFDLKSGNSTNQLELKLECDSKTHCKFTTINQSETGKPRQGVEDLNKVTQVDDLTYAKNALAYAISQQSANIQNAEFSETMNLLRPLFATNPSVDKCWDLNYSAESYMLACTLTGSNKTKQSIYLFATLLSNCGEAFCRYVIYPMTRLR